MITKLRTIDLFCGGGGLSLGLSNAGVEVVAAFDNWNAALDIYRRNIPGHPVECLDLRDSIKAVQVLKNFDCNMIAGGPPCQDFSPAGKRDESGDHANLTISFAEIIGALHPMCFLMENVERAQNTLPFRQALDIFKSAGYGLSVVVLDASLCGVPQRRKRVFVFGLFGGNNNVLIPYIQRYQDSKPMSIRDYVGDSFGVEHYYRHPRSYARRGVFSIDEPSPTIRGVNRPVPKGYPGHSGDTAPVSDQIRPLTTKERSILQTFPKSWDISGGKAEVEQIIGNAVPVKMAEFVGKCILECIKDSSKLEEFKFDRDGNCLLFEQKKTYKTRTSD